MCLYVYRTKRVRCGRYTKPTALRYTPDHRTPPLSPSLAGRSPVFLAPNTSQPRKGTRYRLLFLPCMGVPQEGKVRLVVIVNLLIKRPRCQGLYLQL